MTENELEVLAEGYCWSPHTLTLIAEVRRLKEREADLAGLLTLYIKVCGCDDSIHLSGEAYRAVSGETREQRRLTDEKRLAESQVAFLRAFGLDTKPR